MLYFAYGSNMNWDDLDEWCGEHGYSSIDPGTMTETGVIKGYKLTFNHYSDRRKGGALNIIRSVGDEVCGVLFTLTDEDFQKIKQKEGTEYKPHPVNVFLRDGGVVGAKTFKAKDGRELFAPTDKYLKIVLVGAECFHLGGRCRDQIKKATQEARERAKNSN